MLARIFNSASAFVLGILLFAGGYVLGQSPYAPLYLFYPDSGTPAEAEAAFEPFWEVWHLVQTRYFDLPVDNVVLAEGAINGMLEALGDPYTRYLPPADEQVARESMAGQIEGIGVLVEYVDGNITVVAPFEGSPAEAAGIRAGDILRNVDGVDLAGYDLTEAAGLIRGPAGTSVVLMIERNEETITLSVVRDVISIPSVRGEMLEEQIAYVRLSRFGDRTAEEMRQTLEPLLSQQPVGLILDLRGNPGGGLTSAVDVAEIFLAAGPVLVERFGNGGERVFESNGSGLAVEVPMVVLVDAGSASASEVVAGAIRARGRGILIGETTFGKGTVQTWQPLSNDGGVRITIARWLTPDGTWVSDSGLVPDIDVALPEPAEGAEPIDTQLEAAIQFLSDNGSAVAP